ncbi:MAG: DUF4381 domain-containing protein [Woeseiaceae bacterium]|nr:DUF4381 domain-containing protein [Woeseiaceae bacterium]
MNPQDLPIRDLHLPDATGWWPLAPGWWLLMVVVVAVAAWLTVRYLKARQLSAARRFALKQLDVYCGEYTQHGNAVQLGTELSELVRRTMLAYAPRGEVAGLTGEAWLAWLDRDLDRPHFVEGDGRPLVEWPYRQSDTPVDRSDVAALVDAVRLRLETPVGSSA